MTRLETNNQELNREPETEKHQGNYMRWRSPVTLSIVGFVALISLGSLIYLFPVRLIHAPTSIEYHIDPKAPWRRLDNHSVIVSYPMTWQATTDAAGVVQVPADDPVRNSLVAEITSPDYAPGTETKGALQHGVKLNVYAGYSVFPVDNSTGLVSTENTTWLGTKATLRTYDYEGSFLVLTATVNGSYYQMVVQAADRMTLQRFRSAFLQIAATVKVK